VPKNGTLKYPFASVFWHNLARVTWSLSRDGERILLTNRKANNYARGGRFALTIDWWEGLPREVSIQGYTAALSDRIDEALGSAEMTVGEIVAAIVENLDDDEQKPPADSIRKTLRRGLKAVPQRYTLDGTKWRRAAE
jgi:hypothetical protein